MVFPIKSFTSFISSLLHVTSQFHFVCNLLIFFRSRSPSLLPQSLYFYPNPLNYVSLFLLLLQWVRYLDDGLSVMREVMEQDGADVIYGWLEK